MLTILERSDLGKKLKGFKVHTWNSSNNLPDTATKTFWQVHSRQRKHTVIEYMKMEFFFNELDIVQQRCLFDAPGVLNDDLFFSALIAKRTGVEEKLLIARLNFLRRLTFKPEWNRNLFFTLKGTVGISILECRQAIRPADKYSGYVRNSSSVGSKKARQLSIPEPEIFEWNNNAKIDFLEFLTVGESATGTPGGLFFTLKRTKSPKREPNILKR